MEYPNIIESFKRLVNYEEIYTETLNLNASPVPFIVTVSHDILSDVSFSSVYSEEVSTTPNIGQFRVLYGSNQIELGPLTNNTTVTITYKCAGDIILADHINDLQRNVENVEKTLGINPQGNYSTVAERLSSLEAASGLIPAYYDFSDLCNGENTVFELPDTPKNPDAVWVYVNGLRAIPNVHYVVNGRAIIFISDIPKPTDKIIVDYFK